MIFYVLLLLILCATCLALFNLVVSILPVADGKLAKILKRVRNGDNLRGRVNLHGRENPRGGVNLRGRENPRGRENLRGREADFGMHVSDAAARAKLAMRYRAGEDAFGLAKRAVSKMIVLSGERRVAVEKKLLRAGYSVKAEMFYADVIVRVLAVYLLVPLFLLLGVTAAAAGTVFLGIGLYYKWIGEPDERIRRISAQITDELPRFVSVLGYSMTTDRDLIRTIERYLRIAKPALRNDLELLLLEMKAGNNADALKRFDERVGNAQLSAFISGLIDAGRGVDQKTFFFLMEENMKQLFIENKKKELASRPAKVKKAIISAGLCMFLIYLVPICVQLVEGMTMFK
ncbi:MAG: hypothetical protein FWH01_13365 [Oscillospiraceae bacterium]|nr:hypothetical protein [Oscillospiraceae bacterium]